MRKVMTILLFVACWSSQLFAEFNPPEPPMTWIPAHSTNYKPANRTAADISRIVVHITCTTETPTCNGTLASAVSWFGQQHFPPDKPTSAHFVVGPEENNIVHMVEEKDIAYHAGSLPDGTSYNPCSIGIEHAGFGDQPSSTTDVQHETSARLARWLCSAYGIERTRDAIIGHYQCPGGNPDCPGVAWNWEYYMNLICDDSPPTVAIYEIIYDVVKDGSSATVYWTGYDTGYFDAGIHHYDIWIDSDPITEVTSDSATFTGLSDGPHMVTVKAYDKVLNSSTDYATFWIGEPPDTTTPVMVVGPSEDFYTQDPRGTKNYTLRNNGTASLDWTATSVQSWITVSPNSGTLSAGQCISLTVSVNGDGLSDGSYSGTVTFADTTNDHNENRAVYLTVGNNISQMVITPSEGFDAEGIEGVSWKSKDYTITNSGTGVLDWEASEEPEQPWLYVSPTLGYVSPAMTQTVTISVDATFLTVGSYSGTILFSDIPNNITVSRRVSFTVKNNDSVNLGDCFVVKPTDVLEISGPAQGPFGPELTRTYTVTNVGSSSQSVQASPLSSVVSVSPDSCLNLLSGQSWNFTVTLNDSAQYLDSGFYDTGIKFTEGYMKRYLDLPIHLTVNSMSPLYTLTDLGTLGGDSHAFGVNNHGQVVGTSSRSDGIGRAFLWDNVSGMRDLGTLGGEHDPNLGREDAKATAINDRGEVVGWALDDTGSKRAFLWKAGETWGVPSNPEMKSLGTLGGADDPDDYYALDISNLGQVVGATSCHAWLWTPGGTDGVATNPEMRDLGFIETAATAIAINDDGVVVGHTYVGGMIHAFRWTRGGTAGPPSNPEMQDLGVLPGAIGSAAFGINNRGEVVGVSWFLVLEGSKAHAAYWSITNELVDSGLDPQGDYYLWYSINGINMGGLMVGQSYGTGLPEHTIHWVNTLYGGYVQDATVYPLLWNMGEISDLNNHIEERSGWTLGFAEVISDSGHIVGAMFNNNTSFDHPRAYLATPLEEMGIPMLGLGESRQLSTSLPNTDIHFTLTGGCGCSNVHTWLATEVADPSPSGSWTAFGNKLKIDTDAAQGDFKMVVRIGYDQVDLGTIPSEYTLLGYDRQTNNWSPATEMATSGLTHGYVSNVPGEYAPGIVDSTQLNLGSYGVNTADSFVWAVVDCAGDFSVGYPRRKNIPGDLNADCHLDFVDISIIASEWLTGGDFSSLLGSPPLLADRLGETSPFNSPCQVPTGMSGEGDVLSDIDHNGKVDLGDLAIMAAYWLDSIPPVMVCWGGDTFGEVTRVPMCDDYVAVGSGNWHFIAIKSDGSLACWGRECAGYLNPPAGNDFVIADGGHDHNVALRSDGSLVSWGLDAYGVVSSTPDGNDFVNVDAGHKHSVALKRDGSLVAWGYDGYGQVSQTPMGNDFVAVSCGIYHNLALKTDGSIAAWGFNDGGQAVAPEGNDYVAIAAGGYHSVALREDGSIKAWGRDEFHQVSDAPTGNDFNIIATGEYHTLALKADGSIVIWGADWAGQVSQTPTEPGFVAIAGSRECSCAMR